MNEHILRMQHKGWYVQSSHCKVGDDFVSWASKQPSYNSMDCVYFNFGDTEKEAIDNIIKELDALEANA